MKKEYKKPQIRALLLKATNILAGSQIKKTENEDLTVDDEILDGNDIVVY